MGEQLEIECPKCSQPWRLHGYDPEHMAYTCPEPPKPKDEQINLFGGEAE